jgi:hypothetical protein
MTQLADTCYRQVRENIPKRFSHIMGSSFTQFREKGFWSRDGLLEAWLRVVSLHMDTEAHNPGWQHDLRDNWLLVSAGLFPGCISPSLDDFLTDTDRIAAILRASDRAIQSLRKFGPYVASAHLNALGLAGTKDLPTEWFELIYDCFCALLRGELATDASTSPVLPATQKGQRWDEITHPRTG